MTCFFRARCDWGRWSGYAPGLLCSWHSLLCYSLSPLVTSSRESNSTPQKKWPADFSWRECANFSTTHAESGCAANREGDVHKPGPAPKGFIVLWDMQAETKSLSFFYINLRKILFHIFFVFLCLGKPNYGKIYRLFFFWLNAES
jgi:hypothetical protein